MTTRVVILGCGGFAREVLDVYEACIDRGDDLDVLGFVVDAAFGVPGTLVNDKPILGDFAWLAAQPEAVLAICGVGDPVVRRSMVVRAGERGFHSVIHPSAMVTRRVAIGRGVVITAGCILTNQIVVGNHVQVNLDVTIGHDAVLEDYVTLSPGVHVSGTVRIGEGASIGTGACIIEKRQIGPWSVIGAGSVVTSDIERDTTAVGVPARVIRTRAEGWHLA